jgi:molecular chaperone GrpE
MNDKPGEPVNSGGPEQVDSAAQGAESGQAGAQQLAELKAENAELRDRLLRSIAEMENLRRRTEREKADTSKYAISEFARDAVTIGDNLRRAIEAAQKEPLDAHPAMKTLLEGVEVTERDLFKVLQRHGITRFDPLGEKFDPHVHEAMVKMDVPGAPADVIVQVLHAGYQIADRVLRPAAVIVAKGGTPARLEPVQPEAPREHARPHPVEPAGEDPDPAARPRTSSMHVNVMGESHDPDVVRGPRGAPKGPFGGQDRGRNRPWSEKSRGSSVTRPISEDAGPLKKDDVVSTFGAGKRYDKDEQR